MTIYSKFRNLFFIFIALSISFGCQTSKYILKDEDCPKPVITCSPREWQGIPRDTSEIITKLQGWHYRIEPVQFCNTPQNQWGISFAGSQPYLTIENGNHQSIIKGKYLDPNRILTQKIINYPEQGDIGFPTYYKNDVYYSFADDFTNSRNLVKDSSGRELVPMSEIIGQSRIFQAKIANDEIQNEKSLASITPKLMDWYSHPSISADGNLIFFACERDSGFGGSDIWFMRKLQNGEWSAPINCGDSINSGCDEITPYITNDGKYLYYSSNGFDNVGGYDIFRSDISNLIEKSNISSKEKAISHQIFNKRQNLRPPINTKYNEISPNCLGDCDSIFYYASNQFKDAGKRDLGGYDIFVRYKAYKNDTIQRTIPIDNEINVDLRHPNELKTNINQFYKLEGKVYKTNDNTPIPNAEIIVEERVYQKKNFLKSDIQGNFSIPLIKDEEYIVTAQTEDLFPDTKKVFLSRDDTTDVLIKNFYLQEIYTLRVNFPTDIYDQPYIYVLDTNGNETNIKWQEEMDALASNILQVKDRISKIVLVGHTDTIASVEYNQKLGEKRAEFIKMELMKRGVPGYLIETHSAGEFEPLPKKENEDLSLYFRRLRRVVIERVLK